MGGRESRCENGQHQGKNIFKCYNNNCQQGTQVLGATQKRTSAELCEKCAVTVEKRQYCKMCHISKKGLDTVLGEDEVDDQDEHFEMDEEESKERTLN